MRLSAQTCVTPLLLGLRLHCATLPWPGALGKAVHPKWPRRPGAGQEQVTIQLPLSKWEWNPGAGVGEGGRSPQTCQDGFCRLPSDRDRVLPRPTGSEVVESRFVPFPCPLSSPLILSSFVCKVLTPWALRRVSAICKDLCFQARSPEEERGSTGCSLSSPRTPALSLCPLCPCLSAFLCILLPFLWNSFCGCLQLTKFTCNFIF